MDQNDVDRLSEILIERLQDVTRARNQEDASPARVAITQSLVELGIADDAGVTEIARDGNLRTLVATSAAVNAADRAQYGMQEGPCIEASYDFAATL